MLRQNYSRGRAKVVLSIITSVVFVVVSFLVINNRQYILDQIAVWQFQPTSEVKALVDRAGMNDYGKFLYLASQPILDATQNFNSECDRVENTTSILGCYANNRIYIYDVTNEQLDGIREVTAAHETLHAAYARMSKSDIEKVNVLLEAEYSKLAKDQSFSDRMDFYARTEPGQRDNELFSVVGTEVSSISPQLESYYSNYFADRQKVVALATKYTSVFIGLKNHANDLASQMDSLSSTISSRVTEYNNGVLAVNNDIASFNKRASEGGFSSQAQFNSERAVLSARVSSLDSLRSTIDSDIQKYDKILIEYNSLASESKKLYNSIDSTLAPAPSV